jgi:hypothetical protein
VCEISLFKMLLRFIIHQKNMLLRFILCSAIVSFLWDVGGMITSKEKCFESYGIVSYILVLFVNGSF